MHAIRLDVLFTPERHPGLVYDRAHPHDTNPAHSKFLLLLDGTPIGTTRLDPRGEGRHRPSRRHCQGPSGPGPRREPSSACSSTMPVPAA